jgi:hypothetical protein
MDIGAIPHELLDLLGAPVREIIMGALPESI